MPPARRSSPSPADDLLQQPGGSVPENADAAGGKAPVAASRPATDGKKAAASLRVWSEADEVRILEALASHAAVHGAPPARSQLHAALAGRVLDKAEFTVTEIYEKVRRLRTKYWNLRSTGVAPDGCGGGGDEVRKFELSTAIWGNQPAPGPAPPKVAKKEGSTSASAACGARVRRGFEELRSLYPKLALTVESIVTGMNNDMLGAVIKRAFEFIDDQKAAELDAKVKKQRVREAKMAISRTTVSNEVLNTLIRSMD
uniref:Glabrous enhancer-binding protein-like DBD domain-containing protein n=1 Tax=Arundo donax TaxID=35708 RepID=A0A0A8YW03_ARUDO